MVVVVVVAVIVAAVVIVVVVIAVTVTVSLIQRLRWWPLVPKFAGSNPAEVVGIFRAKKILSTPPFGMEVKPFVPCRTLTADP